MRSPVLACRDEQLVTQSLCVYCTAGVPARPELPKALSPWDVPLKGSSLSSASRNVKFLDSERCRCSRLHISHISHLSCVCLRACTWVHTGTSFGMVDELLISLCCSVAATHVCKYIWHITQLSNFCVVDFHLRYALTWTYVHASACI